MNEFYKHKFSNYAAELEYSLPNLNVVSKSQMQTLLLGFLEFQFGIKLFELSEDLKKTFALRMMAFLFTHRHGKEDKFLAESRADGDELDFDIVRDVMYKYSKKAQDKFFSHPIESFFLISFAGS